MVVSGIQVTDPVYEVKYVLRIILTPESKHRDYVINGGCGVMRAMARHS